MYSGFLFVCYQFLFMKKLWSLLSIKYMYMIKKSYLQIMIFDLVKYYTIILYIWIV